MSQIQATEPSPTQRLALQNQLNIIQQIHSLRMQILLMDKDGVIVGNPESSPGAGDGYTGFTNVDRQWVFDNLLFLAGFFSPEVKPEITPLAEGEK